MYFMQNTFASWLMNARTCKIKLVEFCKSDTFLHFCNELTILSHFNFIFILFCGIGPSLDDIS